MHLSIVIPLFNEEQGVPELARRLLTTLGPLPTDHEVIFIDDGSTDGTPVVLASLHAKNPSLKVIRLARNFGHQAAISAGLHAAAGDAVVVMDGDLQDPPEVIPRLLEKWREGNDVVYAVRQARTEGWLKRSAYRLFYRILRTLSNIDMPLDAGDFSLIDRRVVDVVNSMPERTRFVRGMRSWAGFRQVAIECGRAHRFSGEAKYTFGKLLRLALDGFFSFSYRPLQLASLLGFAASMIAFLLAAFLALLKLTHGIPLTGWTSLIVAVLFVGGVQLITLGILGEYVGRIYDEVRGRPAYVVAEIHGETRLHPKGSR